jgi:pimeloyl-ACP methyl ester carboxylesterase
MPYYYTGGSRLQVARPGVVLIHGAGMDHTVWRYQSRYLAAHGFAVMAVDLPGHGRSRGPALDSVEEMAGWVSQVAVEAGMGTFAVIGHSMGAYIGLELAASRPATIDRIALFGVSDQMKVHPDLQTAADRHQALAADLIVSWSYGSEGRLRGHPQPGTWQLAVTRRLLERELDKTLAGDLAACAHYQAMSAAPRVVCPVLLINGDADRMTSAAAARRLASALSIAHLEVVGGAGHMVMSEQPDRVRRLLVEFFHG